MSACPGDRNIYTCSICSGAATLWSGTILDCGPGSITLRHINFQSQTFDYCGGNITSEIVGIEDNCYISRLEVTAIAKFNNTSIDCFLQNSSTTSVGGSTLYVIQGTCMSVHGMLFCMYVHVMISDSKL